MKGWIGVDLDGTLAEYHGYQGAYHIGKPIPKMVDFVKEVINSGETVKIFTARVAPTTNDDRDIEKVRKLVQLWTKEQFGVELEVTCIKDHGMLVLYDDRAVHVKGNTGEIQWPSGKTN